MSQALFEASLAPSHPRPVVAVDADTAATMRSFCALRAQIVPRPRGARLAGGVSRSLAAISHGTTVALRSVGKLRAGRRDA